MRELGKTVLRWVWVASSLAAVAPAGDDAAAARALLERTRARIREDLARVPNFAYRQNVVRTILRRDRGGLQSRNCEGQHRLEKLAGYQIFSIDRLRLDVIARENRDYFSWPGEPPRPDADLEAMVGQLATTGNYRSFLRTLFADEGAAVIEPAAAGGGEVRAENGRRVREYRYQVAREKSRYVMRVAGRPQGLAYSGTFLLDAEAADLVRLNVNVPDLPPEARACSAATEVVYGRREVGGVRLLFPESSVLDIADVFGDRSHSEITYSEVREAGAMAEPLTAEATETPAIPVGLPATIELKQAVDLTTAVAGDKIEGVLNEALRAGKTVIVPKGSRIQGRILRAAQIQLPVQFFSVWLRFEAAITPTGETIPLRLTPLRYRRVRPTAAELVLYGKDQDKLPRGLKVEWQTW